MLYECLTGARLFVGETATDSIGAILHKEIDFGLLPSETPTRVRELLGRTLERDKERRLRDLGDASLDLEAARDEIGAGSALAGTAKRGFGWKSALSIAAVAAVAGGAGVWTIGPTSVVVDQPPHRPRFTMTHVTDRAGVEMQSSISPDGTTIVYTRINEVGAEIFSQRIGGFNATNLTPGSKDQDFAPALVQDSYRALCPK